MTNRRIPPKAVLHASALKRKPQRKANGPPVIDPLLIETIEKTPEIGVRVKRGKLKLPSSLIHCHIEGSKTSERLITAWGSQRVIEDVVELRAESQSEPPHGHCQWCRQ
jgi:hypothetical protein